MGPTEKRKLKLFAVLDGEPLSTGIEIPDKLPEIKALSDEPYYKRIRISFRSAGSIVIDEDDWDDYEIFNGFLVIKKGESWIAMYNMKDIFSVVLEK